jgi:hypothetical protein
MRSGSSDMITLRYTIPATALAGSRNRYVLTVRHQPGSTLSAIRVHVHAGSAGVLDRTLPLDRDAHISLLLPSADSPGRGTPAARSGPLDPYVPFRFFRDRRHPL